jgi:mono/diheme cytochrome c family protein
MRRRAPLACLVLLAACRGQQMEDQPRYEPLEKSAFFADGRSARPRVDGTVARGQLRVDRAFYAGMRGEEPIEQLPLAITRADLQRGRERYDVFCSPCHGRTGAGDGMVVQRGFRPPPSFHLDRLREAPAGHFYDVVTRGFGAMYSYASRIPPRDRWLVVAYVRALQLSQNAPAAELGPEDRARIEAAR